MSAMFDEKNLLLYLCTDRALARGRSLEALVEAAIKGGVTMVQLREKEMNARDFLKAARAMRALTKRLGVPLIINDRVDIALTAGADGVHLGGGDLPVRAARELAGGRLFIGATARSVEAARAAKEAGADYLGVGAMFPTGTKSDTVTIGPAALGAIREATGLPMVGIGGVNEKNAASVIRAGASGVAVVSAILSRDDAEAAARAIRTVVEDAMRRAAESARGAASDRFIRPESGNPG
ncbi:MAG: thiamine phosphate synthase [Clostridiales Family XIII bacterium]|jgi:thiamine-phosphate pyrophosphorylase|nr:thiamine phosphate synthase [Clostridiales Family XIII bacterium]